VVLIKGEDIWGRRRSWAWWGSLLGQDDRSLGVLACLRCRMFLWASWCFAKNGDIGLVLGLRMFLCIILAICLEYTYFCLRASSFVRMLILYMPKYWCDWYTWSRNSVIVIYWLLLGDSYRFPRKIIIDVVFSWSWHSEQAWMHLPFSPESVGRIIYLQNSYTTLFIIVSWPDCLIAIQPLHFFSFRDRPFGTVLGVIEVVATHTWGFLVGILWI